MGNRSACGILAETYVIRTKHLKTNITALPSSQSLSFSFSPAIYRFAEDCRNSAFQSYLRPLHEFYDVCYAVGIVDELVEGEPGIIKMAHPLPRPQDFFSEIWIRIFAIRSSFLRIRVILSDIPVLYSYDLQVIMLLIWIVFLCAARSNGLRAIASQSNCILLAPPCLAPNSLYGELLYAILIIRCLP